ncbi:hypothetical protein GVAV_001610 [Gurleya vavrai]
MSSRINEIELSSDSADFDHPNIDKKSFMAFKRKERERVKEEKRKRLILIEKEISAKIQHQKECKNKEKEDFINDKFNTIYKNNKLEEIEDEKTIDFNKIKEDKDQNFNKIIKIDENKDENSNNFIKIEEDKNQKSNNIIKIEEDKLNNFDNTYTQNNLSKMSIDELVKEKENLENDLLEIISEIESNTIINNEIYNLENNDKMIEIVLNLLNNNSIDEFIEIIDKTKINLESMQDFILFNLSEQIKEGNDEIGIDMTRLSLYIKYAIEKGRSFVLQLRDALLFGDKKKCFEIEVEEHYKASKIAILKMQNEN